MKFVILYLILYVFSAGCLIMYMVIQGVYANDFKEVGASALALILGTYGAWKLVRLLRILFAHKKIVHILQRIDIALANLTGLPAVGLTYNLFRKPEPHPHHSTNKHRNPLVEYRHQYISSSLFDDDYPGEAAARIKWLNWGGVKVLKEDAEECASRVALWMRLVLRRPRSEPWRLLTSTSPLVKGQIYRVGLGKALRALITHGSSKAAPAGANLNPAEILLNPIQKDSMALTEAAVGFFWVASGMGTEEMGEVLAEMPPRWMRGVTQNGKQLMFELVMSLILCEMPRVENDSLRSILNLQVLHWRSDVTNRKVWSLMADVCTDAVVSLMPRYTTAGEMPAIPDIMDCIRDGIYALQNATSAQHGFQGDIIGLTLIELIRTAYRAGYVTEQIMGEDLQAELNRTDWAGHHDARLYKAEIVTGLCSILLQIGQGEHEEFEEHYTPLLQEWGIQEKTNDVFLALKKRAEKEKEESFNLDEVAQSRYWMMANRPEQCGHPSVAFGSVASTACDISPLIYGMLKGYLKGNGSISIDQIHGDPEKYRENWIQWKHSQAVDLSGSTGALGM